jgi:hypothetical protein
MPKYRPFLKVIFPVLLACLWSICPESYISVTNANDRPFGIAILGDPHLPGKELPAKENLLRTINNWDDIDRVVALYNQELPCPGMAGRDVFAHPEPGRTDGALLRILQQRLAGKTPDGRSG